MPLQKVVVTGAVGLLGSAVFTTLLAHGVTPVGVTRRHRLDLPEGDWWLADLSSLDVVVRTLDALSPHFIVHCAALTDVDWCETHPAEALHFNAEVTRRIGQWARDHGARLIYVSTDSVFDGRTGGYHEDDAPAPLNVYARSKLAGEEHALCAPNSLVVRTNLYGWNVGDKKRLCEWALEKLHKGEPVPGFTDVVISPLSAPDLANAVCDLMVSDVTGIVHLAAADGASKWALLVLFAEGLGYAASAIAPTLSNTVAFAAARPLNTTLVSRRLGSSGIVPALTVAQSMARFTRAPREHIHTVAMSKG